jgi:DNA-binding CsgD family transcriptional regulator
MNHQGKPIMSAEDLQKQIDELKRIHQYQEMELARIAVAAMEKSARLKNLIVILSSLDIDPEVKQGLINNCQELVDQNRSDQTIWSEAADANTDFLSKIQKRFPDLTQKELRILLLIRLDHTNEQIGKIFGLSARGVESVRYRMHNRLGMNPRQTIKTFLEQVNL